MSVLKEVLRKSSQKTKDVLSTTGEVLSNDISIYIMLATAVTLLIASICIPYYNDSTGASSGVYGSGKDCLGFSGQDCMTMHALPVVTILLGALTLGLMTGMVSLPSLPGIRNLNKSYAILGITIVPVLFLAMVFSVSTLATQLGMPLSGTSLADQAKNSTVPTTFKDGMALSAASTALFVFVFIIKSNVIGTLAGKFA